MRLLANIKTVQHRTTEPQKNIYKMNTFSCRMADIAMRLLLLLPFITNGINGANNWILPKRRYNIKYPCGGLVCFHLWEISTSTTSDYIGVITNGKMQTAKSKNEISKCTLPIERLKHKDAGRDICKRNSKLSFPLHTLSAKLLLNLTPAKDMSLQCILLTDVKDARCFTQQFEQISLRWVEADDTPVQENSQYQIKQQSDCDVTLTVTLQSPGQRRFKCQASVGDQTWTSAEVLITIPGKGLNNLNPDPPPQSANQDAIGAAVGVLGCVVLTAGAVLFVVNKRRANNLLNPSNELCYSSSANNVMDEDDVVYTEVTLPLGLDRHWDPVFESTEYACVRNT